MEGEDLAHKDSFTMNSSLHGDFDDYAGFSDLDFNKSLLGPSSSALAGGVAGGVPNGSYSLLTGERRDLGYDGGGVSPPQDTFEVDGLNTRGSCDVGWADGGAMGGAMGGGWRKRAYSADPSTIKRLNLGHTSSSADRSSWGRGSDRSSGYSDQNIDSPSSMGPIYEDAIEEPSPFAWRQRSMSMDTSMAAARHRKPAGLLDSSVYSRVSVYSLRSAFEFLDEQGSSGGVE